MGFMGLGGVMGFGGIEAIGMAHLILLGQVVVEMMICCC